MKDLKKIQEFFSKPLNEYSDENYDSLEDAIANAEFGMDYDQLGPGEKEWVRDEMSMNEIDMNDPIPTVHIYNAAKILHVPKNLTKKP